ncbi:hypothetical protein COW36_12465 [bacterium (Candidatus Blackallbacteria) CG17_big_fil_post_rev_8_21_14_2_50_48_46]|uniref:Uncharacterized protein n=1 Tax=bacterium (Candidatus Blackallbacteria) CG17_big_fil_post_rev_8_21_14_2_50_48_46 TaxID=2014261 RepID=A0A2M7G4W1_9BACT|nr:MAG: hypothetical protein COW64_02795 [bacterium (Candidatus Blackallbacteria) CG18_big_fil_WC_8_21_14_2_50_49_26]PIW16574.1 MAG: hypothetical protein COW36_12465 [bacterium (Candidatus Blackallbacteria) CG17_big_fil_post_rev_8_21_14_2_50_48_46]PIW46082.1 MAG: hypothetical protein COW20_17730 [bacterium (Candidatus Blackallbacteria) CG13_big_fil_rev_8_21_14_2_50_49_14]
MNPEERNTLGFPLLDKFPLKFAVSAVVLTALSAVNAQISPLLVMVRCLLAMLVFLMLGQCLVWVWALLEESQDLRGPLFKPQISQATKVAGIEPLVSTEAKPVSGRLVSESLKLPDLSSSVLPSDLRQEKDPLPLLVQK